MKVLLPQWVTIGAPGLSASSTSKTAGQLLEVEPDLRDGLVGGFLGLGEDGDDRLALEADALLGEDELLLGLDADEPEDGVRLCGTSAAVRARTKPGHPLGLARVDAPDPRVMERAPDHLEVEHAGHDAVGREHASGR